MLGHHRQMWGQSGATCSRMQIWHHGSLSVHLKKAKYFYCVELVCDISFNSCGFDWHKKYKDTRKRSFCHKNVKWVCKVYHPVQFGWIRRKERWDNISGITTPPVFHLQIFLPVPRERDLIVSETKEVFMESGNLTGLPYIFVRMDSLTFNIFIKIKAESPMPLILNRQNIWTYILQNLIVIE